MPRTALNTIVYVLSAINDWRTVMGTTSRLSLSYLKTLIYKNYVKPLYILCNTS